MTEVHIILWLQLKAHRSLWIQMRYCVLSPPIQLEGVVVVDEDVKELEVW